MLKMIDTLVLPLMLMSSLSYATSSGTSFSSGEQSNVSGTYGTSIGYNASVYGDSSSAIGSSSLVKGNNSTAIGSFSHVSGNSAIANGAASYASEQGTALGSSSRAVGANSLALGSSTTANGLNSMSIGTGAQSNEEGSMAIGSYSSAAHNNDVAIGYGSETDRGNSVSFGNKNNTRQLTNISRGTNDTDAVNVSQLKDASEQILMSANNYTDSRVKSVGNRLNYNMKKYTNKKIDQLNYRIDKINRKINKGLASSAALTGLFQPYGLGKANFTAGIGGYHSTQALAIGSGYRINENTAVKAGLAFSDAENIMYNASFNLEW